MSTHHPATSAPEDARGGALSFDGSHAGAAHHAAALESRSGDASIPTPCCEAASPSRANRQLAWVVAVLLAMLAGSYWPVLTELARDWASNEDYSAGMFVPAVAAYLVWEKRKGLACVGGAPFWGAVVLILAAEAARLQGLSDLRQSVERYALVLETMGVVLLVGGLPVFRRVGWILVFLFLMAPLPGSVHNAISGPMQNQATSAANFVLELMGIAVRREGNILTLNDRVQVGVVEACSGLRMMTTFVIVASFLALSIRRPRWQRAALVISSVPVAVACNVVRVVSTAWLLLATDGSKAVETFFHDFAGYAMMPIAVVLLVAELWLMSKLVIEDPPARTTG
ncbi:MAG: exosortase/archaeosortase family protein [Phycisphaerales bacterium]|nr:exosortase/archaeosortase family protein [Phycisphaerales bacterium]